MRQYKKHAGFMEDGGMKPDKCYPAIQVPILAIPLGTFLFH